MFLTPPLGTVPNGNANAMQAGWEPAPLRGVERARRQELRRRALSGRKAQQSRGKTGESYRSTIITITVYNI
jgi:hypothetical protein